MCFLFACQTSRIFAEDLLDKVGFAVVTNSSLAMSINSSPKTWIQLRSWNRTYNYNESNIVAYKIFEWVKNQALRSNSLQWISSGCNSSSHFHFQLWEFLIVIFLFQK